MQLLLTRDVESTHVEAFDRWMLLWASARFRWFSLFSQWDPNWRTNRGFNNRKTTLFPVHVTSTEMFRCQTKISYLEQICFSSDLLSKQCQGFLNSKSRLSENTTAVWMVLLVKHLWTKVKIILLTVWLKWTDCILESGVQFKSSLSLGAFCGQFLTRILYLCILYGTAPMTINSINIGKIIVLIESFDAVLFSF